jgi:hypothetical protein
MKQIAIFLIIGFISLARAGGDYVLELDGKKFEMSLDSKTNLVLPDGKSVSATLKEKEIVTFEGQLFSFEHKSSVTPQRVELQKDLSQTTLNISPVGGVIIVQEYTHLNPVSTVDRMIAALTKKDVAAGYELAQENAERHLADGTVLKGKKVTTTQGDKQWIRNVLATGRNGEGVLVVTIVSARHADEDGAVIEAFWKSLRLKLGGKN